VYNILFVINSSGIHTPRVHNGIFYNTIYTLALGAWPRRDSIILVCQVYYRSPRLVFWRITRNTVPIQYIHTYQTFYENKILNLVFYSKRSWRQTEMTAHARAYFTPTYGKEKINEKWLRSRLQCREIITMEILNQSFSERALQGLRL